MWSLYKKKEGEFLDEYSGEKLSPLIFSNSKTQEDVIKEILEAINSGNKIIFIKGVCGTGKSAIALNLARHFKKTSIVVPIKSLQEQYEGDYSRSKFILKKDNKKMKISVIKGRNNFKCPFLSERADNPELPCTIEIREKNFEKIRKFIEANKNVDKNDFSSIHDVRRMSIAPACEFWSPLLPSEMSSSCFENAKKKKYFSVSGKEYALFQRKKGCEYYNQYENYADADVLIFNSRKYLIETVIGRKPRTELDVIDECDEFLDNFCQESRINLNRFLSAMTGIFPKDKKETEAVKNITKKINELLYDFSIEGIKKLENTPVLELLKLVLDNPYLAEDDEDNYYNSVLEIAREFEDFFSEAYLSFYKSSSQRTLFGKEETCYINLVTINLAKRFKEIIDSTEALVLMSGTLHSEKVLKDIFNINNFKIIEAETKFPGIISKSRTGLEKNCKFENFKKGEVTRKDYLLALSACVKNAKKPVLVHVNSFEDLPSEKEKEEYKINNLVSKEKLKEMQNTGDIKKFKEGKIDLLFTTKCSRGIDFPGEQCNSIIITKYPYPDINSLFWQIFRKEQPSKFMEFYIDKAKRELLQKIYRGLRFKEDHIILLSPDSRVLNDSLR
ncbi:hypothetical protein FJZ19_03290 [Candidatus Pacearchaeota archaeon]|nr:hypothetical protein [Candidatus Pacearchaeota archaeon]